MLLRLGGGAAQRFDKAGGGLDRATTEGPMELACSSRGLEEGTAARAPVGGVSGARIRSRQACARGEGSPVFVGHVAQQC